MRDIQLDDVSDFTLTDNAMTHMGMNDNEKLAIYTIVAAVLHLGNITFEEDEKSSKGASLRLRRLLEILAGVLLDGVYFVLNL